MHTFPTAVYSLRLGYGAFNRRLRRRHHTATSIKNLEKRYAPLDQLLKALNMQIYDDVVPDVKAKPQKTMSKDSVSKKKEGPSVPPSFPTLGEVVDKIFEAQEQTEVSPEPEKTAKLKSKPKNPREKTLKLPQPKPVITPPEPTQPIISEPESVPPPMSLEELSSPIIANTDQQFTHVLTLDEAHKIYPAQPQYPDNQSYQGVIHHGIVKVPYDAGQEQPSDAGYEQFLPEDKLHEHPVPKKSKSNWREKFDRIKSRKPANTENNP